MESSYGSANQLKRRPPQIRAGGWLKESVPTVPKAQGAVPSGQDDQTAQSLLSGLPAIPHTLAFRDPKYYAERRLAKVQKCRPHLDLDGIATRNRGLRI
jgi:hypothetical protein